MRDHESAAPHPQKHFPVGFIRTPHRGNGYAQSVPDLPTPKQLAAELGVTERAVRRWLRLQGWQSMPYTRWHLSPEQAAKVRDHFGRTSEALGEV